MDWVWNDGPWGEIRLLSNRGYSLSDEVAELDVYNLEARAESASSDERINYLVRASGVDSGDPFALVTSGNVRAAVQEALGARPWASQVTTGLMEEYDAAEEKATRYFNARVGLGSTVESIVNSAERSVNALTASVASDYVKKMVHGYTTADYGRALEDRTSVSGSLAVHFDGAGEYLADMIANGEGDLFMGVYEFSHSTMLGLVSQRARAGRGKIQVVTDPLAMTVGKNKHVMVHRALSTMDGVEYNPNALQQHDGTANWFSENSGEFNARLWLNSQQAYLGDVKQYEGDEEAANFYKKWNHEHYKLFTVGLDRLVDAGGNFRDALNDDDRSKMRVMIGSANVTRGAMGQVATKRGAWSHARGINTENVYTLDASALSNGRMSEETFDYMMRSAYLAQQGILNRSMTDSPQVFNQFEKRARNIEYTGFYDNNGFVNTIANLLQVAARQSGRAAAEATIMVNRLSDMSENNAMLAMLQNALSSATDPGNFKVTLVVGMSHEGDKESTREQAEAIRDALPEDQRKMVNIVQNANQGMHSKSFGMRYVDAQGTQRSIVTAGSTNLNNSGLGGSYGRGAAFRNLSVIVDSMEDKGAENSYELMAQFANLSRFTSKTQAGTGAALDAKEADIEALAVRYNLSRKSVDFVKDSTGAITALQLKVGGRVRAGTGHLELGNLMTLTAAAPTADALQKGFGYKGQLWVRELNKFVSPTAGVFNREPGDEEGAPNNDEPFSALESLIAGVSGANRQVERAIASLEAAHGQEFIDRMMSSSFLKSRLRHRIREQVRETFENFQGYEHGTPAYHSKGHGMVAMNMVRGKDGKGKLDMSTRLGLSPEHMYRAQFLERGSMSLPGFSFFFTSGGLSKFKSESEASSATLYSMQALASLAIGARKEGDAANDDNLMLMPISKISQAPQRLQTLLSARNLTAMHSSTDGEALKAMGGSDKWVQRSRLVAGDQTQGQYGLKGIGFLLPGLTGDNMYVTGESVQDMYVKNEAFRKSFKVDGSVADPLHLLIKQVQSLAGQGDSGVTQIGDTQQFYLSYEALERMGHELDVAHVNVDGGLHKMIQTVDTNTQRTPGMGLVIDLTPGTGTTVVKDGVKHSVTLSGYTARQLTSGDRSMLGIKAPMALIKEGSRLMQMARGAARMADDVLFQRHNLGEANVLLGEGVIKTGHALIETGIEVLGSKETIGTYLNHFRREAQNSKNAGADIVHNLRFLMDRLASLTEDENTRKGFKTMSERMAQLAGHRQGEKAMYQTSFDALLHQMEAMLFKTHDHLANNTHTISLQRNADHVGSAALAFGLHSLYYLDQVSTKSMPGGTFDAGGDGASYGVGEQGGRTPRSFAGNLAGIFKDAPDALAFGLVPIFTTIATNAASQALSSRDRVRFLNYHAGGYTDAIFDLMSKSTIMQEKTSGFKELLEIGIFGMHGKGALFLDGTKSTLMSEHIGGVGNVEGGGYTGSAFAAAVAYEGHARKNAGHGFSAFTTGDGNAASVTNEANSISRALESRRKAMMLGDAHKAYITDPTKASYRAEGGVESSALQDMFSSLEQAGVGSVALMVPEIGRTKRTDSGGVVFQTDGSVQGSAESAVIWRQVNLINPAHAKTTGSFEDFSSDVMRHAATILKLSKVLTKLDVSADGRLLRNSMTEEDQESYENLLSAMGSYQEAVRDMVSSDLQKYFGGQLSVWGHNAVIGNAPGIGTNEMVLDQRVWDDMRGQIAKEIVSGVSNRSAKSIIKLMGETTFFRGAQHALKTGRVEDAAEASRLRKSGLALFRTAHSRRAQGYGFSKLSGAAGLAQEGADRIIAARELEKYKGVDLNAVVEYALDHDLDFRRQFTAGIMQRAGAPFGPFGVVVKRDIVTTAEFNKRNPALELFESKYGRGVYMNIGDMAFNLGDFDGDTGSVSHLQHYAYLKTKEAMGTLSATDLDDLKKAKRLLNTTSEEVSFHFAAAYTGMTSVFNDNILYNTHGLNEADKLARVTQLQDINEEAQAKFNRLAGAAKQLKGLDFQDLATNAEDAAQHLFGGDDEKAKVWVDYRARLSYGQSLSHAGNSYVEAMKASHHEVHSFMAQQRAQGFTGSDASLYASFWDQGGAATNKAIKGLLKAAESLTDHDTRFVGSKITQELEERKKGLNESQAVTTNQLAGFFMATSFASSVVMSRMYEVAHAMDMRITHRYFGSARAQMLRIGENAEGKSLLDGIESGLGTTARDVLNSIADGDLAHLQAQQAAARGTPREDALGLAVEIASRNIDDDTRSHIIQVVSQARELETEGQRRRGQMLVLQQIAREAIKPKSAMDSLRQAKTSLFGDTANLASLTSGQIAKRLSDPSALMDVFDIVRGTSRMKGLEALHGLITGEEFVTRPEGKSKYAHGRITKDGAEGTVSWDQVHSEIKGMLMDYREKDVAALAKQLQGASIDPTNESVVKAFGKGAVSQPLSDREQAVITQGVEAARAAAAKDDKAFTPAQEEHARHTGHLMALAERQASWEAYELMNLASSTRGYYSARSAYANALTPGDGGVLSPQAFYKAAGGLGTVEKLSVLSSVFMRGQFKSADGMQLALTDIFDESRNEYERHVAGGMSPEEAKKATSIKLRTQATSVSMTDQFADFTVDAFLKYLGHDGDIGKALAAAKRNAIEVNQENGTKFIKDLHEGLDVIIAYQRKTLSQSESELKGGTRTPDEREKDAKALNAFEDDVVKMKAEVAAAIEKQQVHGMAGTVDAVMQATDRLVKHGLDEGKLAQGLDPATSVVVAASEDAAAAGKPHKPGAITQDDKAARAYLAARASLVEVASIADSFSLNRAEGPAKPAALNQRPGHVDGVMKNYLERVSRSSYAQAMLGAFVPNAFIGFAMDGFTQSNLPVRGVAARLGDLAGEGMAGLLQGQDPKNFAKNALKNRQDPERWVDATIQAAAQVVGAGVTAAASEATANLVMRSTIQHLSEAHGRGDFRAIRQHEAAAKSMEFKAKAAAGLVGNVAGALAGMGVAWVGQALAVKFGMMQERGQVKEALSFAQTYDSSNQVTEEFSDLDALGFDGEDVDEEGVITIRDENGNVIEQSFYRASWASREAHDESSMGILEAGLDTHVSEGSYESASIGNQIGA